MSRLMPMPIHRDGNLKMMPDRNGVDQITKQRVVFGEIMAAPDSILIFSISDNSTNETSTVV